MKTQLTPSLGNLLAKSAKAHLDPIGMERKGKSRVWFKDHRWWVALVEFQPSSWSKGTYLNVAANWLWHPKDYFVFDEFERVEGFAEYSDSGDFALLAEKYSSRAAEEVRSMEKKFSTLEGVAKHLRSLANGNPWHHYHAMMASLATGALEAARTQQLALSRIEHDVPWCIDLKTKADLILKEASDAVRAKAVTAREINAARNLLGLGAMEPNEIWQVSR